MAETFVRTGRRRARQISVYTGTPVVPPVIPRGIRRTRDQVEQDDIPTAVTAPPTEQIPRTPFDIPQERINQEKMRLAFADVMQSRVEKNIKTALNNEDELKAKKRKLMDGKQLPKAVCPDADVIAGLPPGSVARFVNRNEAQEKPVNYWKMFVDENFETISDNMSEGSSKILDYSMLKFTDMEDITMESIGSLRSYFSGLEVGSDMSGIEATGLVTLEEQTEEPRFETFTISLSSILRRDLEQPIRNIFNEKIQAALSDISDFTANLQFITLCLISNFRNFTFNRSNNHRFLVKEATNEEKFNLRSLFPAAFIGNSDTLHSAPCIPKQLLRTNNFRDDFKHFFTRQHLDFVYRSFFSAQGPRQATVERMSLQHSFNRTLPDIRDYMMVEEMKALPEPMKSIAFELFAVNFDNMWKNRVIINKLLNKSLDVLLKIHLAPVREAAYRDYINSRQARTDQPRPHIIEELSRDHRRLLIRKTHYKLNKLNIQLAKLKEDTTTNEEKINNCERQIDLYNDKIEVYETMKVERQVAKRNQESDNGQPGGNTLPAAAPEEHPAVHLTGDGALLPDEDIIPENELFEAEDEEAPVGGDLTRRRLNQLKGKLKNLFFKSDTQLKGRPLQDELSDLSAREHEVCRLIYTKLKPYIPRKKFYSSPCFQLPFVLLATDILHYAGYSKLTVNLCPMPSTSLNGLRMDSTSMYALFCAYGENRLLFSDFDRNHITRQSDVIYQKDAIFNQFFDLDVLLQQCRRRKLAFGHNITVLPGCKYVRVLGTKTNRVVPENAFNTSRTKRSDLPWEEIREQWQRSRNDENLLSTEIEQYKTTINNLYATVRRLRVQINDIEARIKDEKDRNWVKALPKEDMNNRRARQPQNNQATYQRVQELKAQHYAATIEFNTAKRELSDARFQQYIRIKARDTKNEPAQPPPVQRRAIVQQPLIGKVEDLMLHPEAQYIHHNYTFSGTDNGIVKMTESINITMDSFAYHLDLYNRYSVLQDVQENDDNIEYRPLERPVTTHSGDIDLGGGYLRSRQRLERRKKNDEEVTNLENELKTNSIKNATTTDAICRGYRIQTASRARLRRFYQGSNKDNHLKRKNELIDERFRDRWCSKERDSLVSEDEKRKTLVMFIGDRGTGVGSSIKGHRRYGGVWKQKRHARYTPVCITNENKTSQTCVYCFQQLSHPRTNYTITRNNEQRTIRRNVNGAFICRNPRCVLSRTKRNTQTRDSISAAAIALTGIATVLFQQTFPQFSTKISQSYTEFNNTTLTFVN